MIRKEVTYKDINEVQRTEPFYFHFNELELMETELELGGVEETIQRLTETQDLKKAYYIFKDLILAAYGKKAADGKGFDKEDPDTGRLYRKELLASPALSALIIELMSDPEQSQPFFRGMLPADLQSVRDENDKALADNPQLAPGATPESVEEETPVIKTVAPTFENTPKPEEEKTWRDYTTEELLKMPTSEFNSVAGTDPRKMDRDLLVIAMRRKSQ